MNALRSFIVLIASLTILVSCSGGNRTPMTIASQSPDLPDAFGVPVVDTNRDVLAVYDAVIDPDAKSFTITPVERVGTFHFPLTQWYPNVLQITGYGWTPNFWADIKLTHPFPGSHINTFDPRVIAILPSRPGVRFIYPIFNCFGNNKAVLDPDGYTKLFDNLGGSILGNTNPFKTYFKDQPYRVWSGTGVIEETQRWQMDVNGFGGSLQIKLVVDVSTNYPNPPQPIIDNAPEPVQIKSFIERDLTTAGGDSLIEVTFLDWQGPSDIKCKVESPDLFADAVQLFYSRPGLNPNEYIFSGTISNSLLAPVGEHKVLIAAWDIPTDIHTFCEATAIVSDEGNLIRAKRAGGTGADMGEGIATLSDNSTVVTGYFSGVATFGPGETNQKVLNSAGGADIFIARYNLDGTLAWAKPAGGSNDDWGVGITALSDNSTVVTGTFHGLATFGIGEPKQTALTSAGNDDTFIARYNPDGTLAWAKRAGGSDDDMSEGIITLSNDSTVVTGVFGFTSGSSATFGAGEINQTILISAGNSDIFIAMYNPDGTLEWAKDAGSSSVDFSFAITALSDNTTVVTGGFNGSATFGPGESNQTVLASAGGSDIFIARYNPDGTLSWAKRSGGANYDYGYGITNLSDNSTVVTGWFSDSATFGPGDINQTVLISAGSDDTFIARYNPDGTLEWAKRAGGTSDDEGYEITTLSDNSTVVVGNFNDSAIFGPGEKNETVLTSDGDYDIFITRYNTDGTLAWAKRAGGANNDFSFGITNLSDNSTVVTGYFSESATFGQGESNETILTSAGAYDIFIARFKP